MFLKNTDDIHNYFPCCDRVLAEQGSWSVSSQNLELKVKLELEVKIMALGKISSIFVLLAIGRLILFENMRQFSEPPLEEILS